MAEAAQKKVQTAVESMMDELDLAHMRKMQVRFSVACRLNFVFSLIAGCHAQMRDGVLSGRKVAVVDCAEVRGTLSAERARGNKGSRRRNDAIPGALNLQCFC